MDFKYIFDCDVKTLTRGDYLKEIIHYNRDGIKTVTFHYKGDEDALDRFMRLIIKDCLVANKIIEDKRAS